MSPETAANLNHWLTLGGTVEGWPPQILPGAKPDVAVDCLLGTGSSGDPRGEVAEAIAWLNQLACQRVAIDLPSGLDCDSGLPGKPTFRAHQTLTMWAPSSAFMSQCLENMLASGRSSTLGFRLT